MKSSLKPMTLLLAATIAILSTANVVEAKLSPFLNPFQEVHASQRSLPLQENYESHSQEIKKFLNERKLTATRRQIESKRRLKAGLDATTEENNSINNNKIEFSPRRGLSTKKSGVSVESGKDSKKYSTSSFKRSKKSSKKSSKRNGKGGGKGSTTSTHPPTYPPTKSPSVSPTETPTNPPTVSMENPNISEDARAPTMSEDIVAMSEDMGPVSGDMPPMMSEDEPPMSEDTPPMSADMGPISGDMPPMSEDMGPISGDVPPMSEDSPPMSEDQAVEDPISGDTTSDQGGTTGGEGGDEQGDIAEEEEEQEGIDEGEETAPPTDGDSQGGGFGDTDQSDVINDGQAGDTTEDEPEKEPVDIFADQWEFAMVRTRAGSADLEEDFNLTSSIAMSGVVYDFAEDGSVFTDETIGEFHASCVVVSMDHDVLCTYKIQLATAGILGIGEFIARGHVQDHQNENFALVTGTAFDMAQYTKGGALVMQPDTEDPLRLFCSLTLRYVKDAAAN